MGAPGRAIGVPKRRPKKVRKKYRKRSGNRAEKLRKSSRNRCRKWCDLVTSANRRTTILDGLFVQNQVSAPPKLAENPPETEEKPVQDRGPEKYRKRAGKGPEKGAERGGRAAEGAEGGRKNAKRSVKRSEKRHPKKGPEKSRRGSTGMRGSGQARRNARGQRKALLAGTLPD